MSPRTRLVLGVAATTLLISAWIAHGSAQIWFPYPYPPHYRYAGAEGAVRLEVTPKEAEVYVDGYYAGIVDNFDGAFQRLRVVPGEHEFTLYLDGYRPLTRKIYVMPDGTFKLRQRMEPLAAGEVAEPRPAPANPPVTAPSAPSRPLGRRPPPPANAPPPPSDRGPLPPRQSATGTLAIRVQPADADVLIDGQLWHIAEGRDRLTVDASEGGHNVQIRKVGYVGYLTDVQVRRGETTTIDVNLRMQP